MRKPWFSKIDAVVLLSLSIVVGCFLSRQSGSWDASSNTIRVSEGEGTPVLLDGTISEGEWADALTVPATESITLYFKKYGGFVFIGVDCSTLEIPTADLFFAGDSIRQFHVSSDLGERVLALGENPDSAPPLEWGRISGWSANEVRWSATVVSEKEAAGLPRREAMKAAVYPYGGFEYQFRESKLAGQPLRFRAWIRYRMDRSGSVVFPQGTSATDTAGWATIILF